MADFFNEIGKFSVNFQGSHGDSHQVKIRFSPKNTFKLMANPFLKLNLRRPISDGTYPIVIAIGNGRDLYLSTGVYADKDTGWDANARQCVGPGAKQKNAVLATILAQTINRIIQLKEEGQFESLSNKELKTLLTDPDSKVAEVKKASQPTLHGLFPKVAATKNKRSQELYLSTLQKVEDFCQPSEARLDDINKMWLDNFCVRYSHLAANTLSIHLRNIRAVINYAIDCELTTNYPFRRYSIPKSPIKKKAVPVETIRKLAHAKLPDHLCKWRDAMMLMFCLAGINIGDMCNLKEIAEGRVDYQEQKHTSLIA